MKISFIKKVGVSGLMKMAIVAALYACTTIMLPGLSYGPVQVRFSELLNFLAFIDPYYIPALTLGCAISNFYSFGLIDVIVGSFATLLSTYAMYKCKNMIIASLWPVINCVFVAGELYFLGLEPFWFSLGTIALGEFVVMTILGIPIFKIIFRNRHFVESVRIDLNDNSYLDKLKFNISGNVQDTRS